MMYALYPDGGLSVEPVLIFLRVKEKAIAIRYIKPI